MTRMLSSDNVIQLNTNYSRLKYFTNLINPSYFYRSIKHFKRDQPEYAIKVAPPFLYSEGIEDPVVLPDGSLIHSKKYIASSKASKIRFSGHDYKIKKNRSQISETAVKLFCSLLKALNNNGIETVIVMTPYHHNVWANEKSTTVVALIEVGARIRKLGKDLNIKVLGSYNPEKIGCSPDEFWDYGHAKDSCLSKIPN